MANVNVDVVYEIYASNINNAIDAKNKIIANTLTMIKYVSILKQVEMFELQFVITVELELAKCT